MTATAVRPATPPPGYNQQAATPPPESGRNTPTNIGPTFLSAAAILTGASALSTPISGHSWVLPLIEVVAVIWLIGIGGRLIRLPTAVTALLQLAGFAIALTSLFTSSGIGGVLPNSAAVSEAGTLLSGAWSQIVGSAPPAPSTPELSFLIALAIGTAAFIADFLVAEARSPALVALPLLCLYSVPASIASTMLPWYSFAVPAVLYAVLLAVTGHRDRHTGVRAGVGLAINGGAITVLATVVALLVAGSVTSVGTTGRLPHTNGTNGGAIGLSPFASLRGSLKSSAAVNVLTAKGLKTPDYFRTVALTRWTDNQGWSLGDLQADIPDVDGQLEGAQSLPTDSGVTVTPQGYKDRFLPILTGTNSISGLAAAWNFDAALNTVFRSDQVRPAQYSLSVNQSKPTAATLEADSVVSGGDLTETGSLAASVKATALQVTSQATGAYDKALALEQWFTNSANGFVYSLDVKAGSSGDALVDFLNNKQGYCEQYASAMAIMLRSLNIPTRVVVGFTQGVKLADGSYQITSHDAHAWVEVNFVDNGWIRFDPTPPVGGQGGLQGFQQPTGPTATKTSSTTVQQTTTPTTKNKFDTTTKPSKSTAVATQIAVANGGSGSAISWVEVVLLVLAAVLVLLGLLMLPTGLRLRRRRRRLVLARSGRRGAAVAAWTEIEDTAIDHGIVPHSAESARVTANRLARRAHLDDSARLRLRAVVVAAEREWYGAPATSAGAESGAARSGTAGSSPVAGSAGTATATLERTEQSTSDGGRLADGVLSIVRGLRENAPIRLSDRVVPRSMRRASR